MRNLLVIKFGGMKEFIFATGAFSAIRESNKDANIILLTSKNYEWIAKQTGYFNEILVDDFATSLENNFFSLPAFFRTLKILRSGCKQNRFSGVFDLQRTSLSKVYFRCIGRNKPDWSGNIEWCSHPYIEDKNKTSHILDVYEKQLEIVGIKDLPPPHVSFLKSDISKFGIKDKFALISVGGYVRGDPKRWNDYELITLMETLIKMSITPILLGAKNDLRVMKNAIIQFEKDLENKFINLINKTSLADIAELARNAEISIGIDNDIMYIIAATNNPAIMIYSTYSDTTYFPEGDHLEVIVEDDLTELEAEEVISVVEEFNGRKEDQ